MAVLAVGTDLLVRGAYAIAGRLGLGALVIGLTIVAVGTSLHPLNCGVISMINLGINLVTSLLLITLMRTGFRLGCLEGEFLCSTSGRFSGNTYRQHVLKDSRSYRICCPRSETLQLQVPDSQVMRHRFTERLNSTAPAS